MLIAAGYGDESDGEVPWPEGPVDGMGTVEGHAGRVAVGRFAPSPTGALHLGNLRTALVAWLYARSTGSPFLVRMEDLDPNQSSVQHEAGQLHDLAALGLDWDGPVVRQSDRFDRYEAAIDRLSDAGLTYPCFCSRREIREAAAAPHGLDRPDGAYPGTCRDLTEAECTERAAGGRPSALRLRSGVAHLTVLDDLRGPVTAAVDDVVLRRNDGVAAYNLAVVVDDAVQGVEQVVRGDDLLSSSPRQRHLGDLLGLAPVRYAHVPLAVRPDGVRLAKRDGAVTMADQADRGMDAARVRLLLAVSLELAGPGEPVEPATLIERFDPARLPSSPWVVGEHVRGRS